jgi:hypothetical protein
MRRPFLGGGGIGIVIYSGQAVRLRASMSLALCRSQGTVHRARERWLRFCGWFTEGFDTRDLKEAKALLKDPIS